MEELLMKLESMKRAELQALWLERFGEKCTLRSVELLRRQITWRLQEEQYCGLKPETKRQLRDLAQAFDKDAQYRPKAKPKMNSGTILTRNWKGKIHTVTVKKEGYIYKGEHYKGLSKIAREITGTRWSGPVFFGLKKPKIKAKMSS